jgi:4-methyl-5(b-hydroxyethyl)-thiazole monophosphate biosynthesis
MKALLLLADGFSEADAFTVVDILSRAGIPVTTASLSSSVVAGSSKAKAVADKKITDTHPDAFDIVILPGGPGHKNLLNSSAVIELVRNFNKKGKYIAAMCESPAILAAAGIMDDKIATINHGMENKLPRPRDARVIVAKNVITARNSAAAVDFALKLSEIMNPKGANKVKREMMI